MTMELSIRGYARHRGVAESAVRKAILQGRITKGKNGKINPKLADKEWGQNSDPAQIKAENTFDYSQNSAPNSLSGPSYQQSRAI